MEKSIEKSQQQANIIRPIGILAGALDVPYCRQAAEDMIDQAARQHSMSVLNLRYQPLKTDILHQQGRALRLLCDYVDALKKVDELREKLNAAERAQVEIDKLFL